MSSEEYLYSINMRAFSCKVTLKLFKIIYVKFVQHGNFITMKYYDLFIRCIKYMFSGTARGTPPTKVQSYSDYISRSKDHNSMIRFDKGEDKKMCTVTIIDDTLFEEEERFSLVLVQPTGGRIGNDRETVIVIGQDPDDGNYFRF